jgi:hypothetical protein
MSVMVLCFNHAAHSAIIPGRREAASPESILPGGGYGFRAPAFGRPRNDAETLGSAHATT